PRQGGEHGAAEHSEPKKEPELADRALEAGRAASVLDVDTRESETGVLNDEGRGGCPPQPADVSHGARMRRPEAWRPGRLAHDSRRSHHSDRRVLEESLAAQAALRPTRAQVLSYLDLGGSLGRVVPKLIVEVALNAV